MGVLLFFFTSLDILVILNGFPQLQVFSPVSQRAFFNFFKMMMYVVSLIFVFAGVFHFLLSDNKAFATFPQSIVMTLVMLLGEFEYTEIFVNEKKPLQHPRLSNAVFIIFVTVVLALIVNIYSKENDTTEDEDIGIELRVENRFRLEHKMPNNHYRRRQYRYLKIRRTDPVTNIKK